MKHPVLKTLAVASLAAFAIGSVAQAQSIVGNSSNPNEVLVGVSAVDGGPHSSGRPGIAVPATGLAAADIVDFQGLVTSSNTDSHGVTTLDYPNPSPPGGGEGFEVGS